MTKMLHDDNCCRIVALTVGILPPSCAFVCSKYQQIPKLDSLKPFCQFRRALCIKTQACPPGPGISVACDGVKQVISPYGPWIANVYKEDSCENVSSTLLPQFAACCRLLFLLPVGREQAAAEASVVPLHSKTDFYFKNRLPGILKHSTQIWARLLTVRCHLDVHTHRHTTRALNTCTNWQPQLEKSQILCCPACEGNHVWSVFLPFFLFIYVELVLLFACTAFVWSRNVNRELKLGIFIFMMLWKADLWRNL